MDPHLATAYNHTKVNQSTSAQVLSLLNNPETEKREELLSQSDTVAASYGQDYFKDVKAYRRWTTVVTFDEQTAVAKHKYFFFYDEKQRNIILWHPKWASRFDAQLVVDKAVLEKPYANENARRIAIIEWVREKFRDDVAKVKTDNKYIGVCQDMVNETFSVLLRNLRESPVYASLLTAEKGFMFDHPSFYNATAYMTEVNDVVTMKLKCGSIFKQIDDPNDANE
jgi:hypothetical protein